MKKPCAYIVVVASLIVGGVVFVKPLPFDQRKPSSVLSEQVALFESLLPEVADRPAKIPAEPTAHCAHDILPAPSIVASSEPQDLLIEPLEEQPAFEPARLPPAIPQSLVTPMDEVEAPFTLASATPAQRVVHASTPPAQETPAAPVSYIYFFTGVPVKPAPTATVFYSGGFASVTAASTQTMQTYAVPVFVPQIVPSRVGAPKWVYSNGVVIKPKVYFPNQPIRNTVRVVTP